MVTKAVDTVVMSEGMYNVVGTSSVVVVGSSIVTGTRLVSTNVVVM